MTLTLQFTDSTQIDELQPYLQELYEYIDLDKNWIPGSMNILREEKTVIIYMTEEFFRYSYQFFMNILVMDLSAEGEAAKRLNKIAKEFRQGAEGMLMSNVLLE